MNKAVQIIVTPSGERLAVLPEEDYLLLLAASEDEEGERSRNSSKSCVGVVRRSLTRERSSRWTRCAGRAPERYVAVFSATAFTTGAVGGVEWSWYL